MPVFTDFHPSAAGDSARGECNGEEALICVQSTKHLHRALVACYECAGVLAVSCGPAKPPNFSPEDVQCSVLSFCNPVSVFTKMCNSSESPRPMSEMPEQMAKPGLP